MKERERERERERELQIKLSISPNHSILTPGQPVLALTPKRHASSRVATRGPVWSHRYDPAAT